MKNLKNKLAKFILIIAGTSILHSIIMIASCLDSECIKYFWEPMRVIITMGLLITAWALNQIIKL